jgi:hypothetical protein
MPQRPHDPDATGAINPYALAELVSGRTIAWQRIKDPRTVLETVLRTPYAELFDPVHDSPIYAGLRLTKDLALEPEHPPRRHPRAELAEVLTPRIMRAVIPSQNGDSADSIASEPPVSFWGDSGRFFNEAAEVSDPIQGGVPNCYLIAAMSAVASAQPHRIKHMTRATGPGQQDFVNTVRFFDEETHAAHDVEVGDAIPLNHSNKLPLYARSSDSGECWPSILEKAYAKWESGHKGDRPDIPSTANGSAARACAQLTGLTVFRVATKDTSADDLWSLVQANSKGSRTKNPMVAATYPTGGAAPGKVVYADANLVAGHAYSVLGWHQRKTKRYVILRNPWGKTEASAGNLDETLNLHDLGSIKLATNDGIFGLEIGVFKKYFGHLGGAHQL